MDVRYLTPGTSPEQDLLSACPEMPPLEFPTLNGIESSEEKSSTSTISSLLSTILQLAKRERLTLETQKSALEWLTQNSVLPPQPTGLQHGNLHPKLSNLLSLTTLENLLAMASSFPENLWPSSPVLTPRLYSTTLPSRTSFKGVNVLCSPTNNSTCASGPPSSCLTLLPPVPPGALITKQSNLAQVVLNSKSATDLTELMVVPPLTSIVATATSARNAKRLGTEGSNVPPTIKPYCNILGARPRYLCYNLWDSTTPFHPTVADWSETAVPLPPPPPSELNDPVVHKTIAENPHLFLIVMLINVDVFESLLSDHRSP